VCRLRANAPLPAWVRIDDSGGFVSVTRTPEELSLVVSDAALPPGLRTEDAAGSYEVFEDHPDLKAERGWTALRIAGTLDFGMTGVLAALTGVLAPVGITVFTISTYDTDYLFVRHESLERAARVLRLEGHTIDVG